MDLVALRYFTETAKMGNITKASEMLGISPSAVFRQIKLLETELGVPLYKKSKNGLVLTSPGEELYRRAVDILSLSDAAVRDISNSSYSINEPLSIAFMDGAFSEKIASDIDGFKNNYPEIKMSFFSGVHKNVIRMVEKKEADIGCLYFYQTPKSLQYIKTDITKPFGILMSKEDELKSRRIDSAVLESIPLIVPQTSEINTDRISNLPYDTSGKNILAKTDSTYTFLDMVLSKQGYIFCIEPSPVHLNNSRIIFRPVFPQIDVTLYYTKNPHPVHQESAEVFFEYLQDLYS